MIGSNRFIQTIKIRNLLSFGPNSEPLELRSLNVLIGTNGVGKSNLLEVIGLLQAAPKDLTSPFRGKGGGSIQEWLWKGTPEIPTAEIEATLSYLSSPSSPNKIPLRHKLSFTMTEQKFDMVDEAVENAHPESSHQGDVRYYYRYLQGRPVLNVFVPEKERASNTRHLRTLSYLQPGDIPFNQSILSQKKGINEYPEITYLGKQYEQIRLYREWNLGRNTPPRRPQPTDVPDDFLEEDANNLVLVLNSLDHITAARETILKHLKTFQEPTDRLNFKVHGGTVQLFLEELIEQEGASSCLIPATRLSDGTMRFLCLLAMLCHPTPPPLICIEEPEIGLHPDIIPLVAELLISASHRTQLIVTTHSDILLDALTKVPEAVVVCEKHQGSTQMRRLQADELAKWLTKYRLGNLWLRGDIGGTRW